MLNMSADGFPVHERPSFFEGQRLLAADLQAVESFNREMRWLHNRSLHQVGIGSGLAIAGVRGDREVTVTAGYAIDDLGREIVLTEPVTLAVPPVAGAGNGRPAVYDLTVAYAADDALEEAETRAVICAPGERGAVRLREAPALCWVPVKNENDVSDLVKQGRRIALGRIGVVDCQLDSLAIDRRRNARPSRQPYIACGVETPTSWGVWEVEVGTENGSRSRTIGLRATIDTRGARFAAVPCYSVRIDGPRPIEITSSNGAVHWIFDGPVSTEAPKVDSLVVRVLLLQVSFQAPVEEGGGGINLVEAPAIEEGAALANGPLMVEAVAAAVPSPLDLSPFSGWSVAWMGVEG